MSRIVKIYTAQNDSLQQIESSATTWGELKAEMKAAAISADGMKATVKTLKVTLENDGAALPEGEFTIFLTAAKMKSGK